MVALLLFMWLGGSEPQELGCLEEQWQEIEPAKTDKAFDLVNDYDEDGRRYSCNAYLTPTEIAAFLKSLKTSLEQNDREAVALAFDFPIRVSTGKIFIAEEGNLKLESFEIEDKASFLARYKDLITPTFKKVIECAEFTNMFAHPYQGIAIANGGVWLSRTYEEREIHIVSISVDSKSLYNWISENCKN